MNRKISSEHNPTSVNNPTVRVPKRPTNATGIETRSRKKARASAEDIFGEIQSLICLRCDETKLKDRLSQIDKEVLEVLVYKMNAEGRSLIDLCARNNWVTLLQFIKANVENLDVNQENFRYSVPLYIAIQENHYQCAQLLIEYGTDVNIKRGQAIMPHEDAMLISADPDRKKCKDGQTPLIEAIVKGALNFVQLLLDNGAQIDRAGNNMYTPLLAACGSGQIDCAELLLDRGAQVDLAANNGFTPLITACGNGQIDCAELLLDRGAQIDRAANNGYTPLLAACDRGQSECVKLLLDRGAQVDLAANNGFTPLITACGNGQSECVKLLLERGAQIDRAANNGCTPLISACGNVQIDCAELLLDRGAQVDLAANNGLTPLIAACGNGQSEFVKLLIKNGAKYKYVKLINMLSKNLNTVPKQLDQKCNEMRSLHIQENQDKLANLKGQLYTIDIKTEDPLVIKSLEIPSDLLRLILIQCLAAENEEANIHFLPFDRLSKQIANVLKPIKKDIYHLERHIETLKLRHQKLTAS